MCQKLLIFLALALVAGLQTPAYQTDLSLAIGAPVEEEVAGEEATGFFGQLQLAGSTAPYAIG